MLLGVPAALLAASRVCRLRFLGRVSTLLLAVVAPAYAEYAGEECDLPGKPKSSGIDCKISRGTPIAKTAPQQLAPAQPQPTLQSPAPKAAAPRQNVSGGDQPATTAKPRPGNPPANAPAANPPAATPPAPRTVAPLSTPIPAPGPAGRTAETSPTADTSIASGAGLWRRILVVFPRELGNGLVPAESIVIDKGSSCAASSAKDTKEAVRADMHWGVLWIDCLASSREASVILTIPGFENLQITRQPNSDRYPPRVDVSASDLVYKSNRVLTVNIDGADRTISLGRNWWKVVGDERVVGDFIATELGRPDYRACGLKPALTIADLVNAKDAVALPKREIGCARVDLKDWPQATREAFFKEGKCSNVERDSASVRTATTCVLPANGNPAEQISIGPIWKPVTVQELLSQPAPPKLLTLSTANLAAAMAPAPKEGAPKYELKAINLLDAQDKPICKAPLPVQVGRDLVPWATAACSGTAAALQLDWERAGSAAGPLGGLTKQNYTKKIALDAVTLPRLTAAELLPPQVPVQVEFKGGSAPDIAYLRSFESLESCNTKTAQPVGPISDGDERLRSDGRSENSFELTLGGPAGLAIIGQLVMGAAAIHDGQQFQSKCGQGKVDGQQKVTLSLDADPSVQKSFVLLISTSSTLRDRSRPLRDGLYAWLAKKREQMLSKPDSDVAAFRFVTIGVLGTTESRLLGRHLPGLPLEGVPSVSERTEINFEGSRQALADINLVVTNYANASIKRLLYIDGQKSSMVESIPQQGGGIYHLLGQGVELSIMAVGAGRCKEWKQQKGWEKIDCWEFPADHQAPGAADTTKAKLIERLDWLVRPLAK